MPLCKACKDIDLQRFRCHADGCLRIRYNDTKRNAHAGCDLCSLVLAAADDRRERSPYQTSWIRLSLNGKYDPITDKTVGCTRLHISVGEFKFEADRAFGQKPNPEDAPDEICVVADQGEQVFLDVLSAKLVSNTDKLTFRQPRVSGKCSQGSIPGRRSHVARIHWWYQAVAR